jgi:hypothetical protein
MSYALHATTSLIPAQPGWKVCLTSGDDRWFAPLVGWAVVVVGSDSQGGMETDIQPAFVWDGIAFTPPEFRQSYDDSVLIEVRSE